ncbi:MULTISPECIES: filamentous haemagglutinin family protein [unclassified Burkholderia]|uniref:filamentous haemagglutinin family protein n=2 Tax=Burkholderia TaxID=32008 RepID=UPI00141E4469|nr:MULTISPECIES: filamentous haemagglutinin family protein [unclassified Burkholderia]NIE85185.1 filamentous hemagglutinin N-terminal domain-containing protein [Burkholderia sp. Tr-860]NIF98734.1 filamentous hemagglutinin N-terminal domain-containing protein [Burkholderia sp. Ax-1720]
MAANARTARQHQRTAARLVLQAKLSPVHRAVALLLAAGFSAHAQAGGIVNLGTAAPRPSGSAAGLAGIGATTNLGMSPQAALQASQPSIRNLGYTAQAIAAQIAAQNAAAAAAANTLSNVPNGLAAGGLQVANGASADPNNPLLWINANAPAQSVDANGHVTVDVQQTAQNAVLTWQTMNVGRQTTLNFDQSAGTQTNGANNWAVLNRVMDPSGRPSQILGSITAQGAVYVINRNGILFGAGSQVNVHALVASSLDLLNMNDYNQTIINNSKVTGGKLPVLADSTLAQDAAGLVASNKQFLSLPAGTTGGLAANEAGSSGSSAGNANLPNEVLGLGNQVNLTSASQYQPWGDVTVAQGASITTHANGTASDGGFVMIAAPNVTNAGSISATDGQVVLAAGVGVSLRPNTAQPQVLLPELSGAIALFDPSTGTASDITPVGALVNTGIIQASRGNVSLLGGRVDQNGVVGVTTSVNSPGTITISTVDEYASNNPLGAPYLGQSTVTLDVPGGGLTTHRAGLLSFGPDSVTAVLPDNNGQTTTSTPGAVFTPGSITMTGGAEWFQGGSLIEAPGSTVSVVALAPSVAGLAYTPDVLNSAVPGRIYLDNGANIDVSGLANVELPISSILLTIPRIGQNELADSPLLRDGFLFGLQDVVVDSTLTGTRSDGVQWVGSPILNLAGYVNLIPRTVDQLLTNGGTIELAGNEVMTASGSSILLNGGYTHYDGGMVNTTRLVDANGAIVPIGQASPYDTYLGIAGAFTETHARWGVTKTWYNPLQSGGGTYQSDFIVGGNAGTLDIYGASATVLDGDISAQALGGAKQTQGDSLPEGGTFNLGVDAALTGSRSLINLATNGTSPQSGLLGLVIVQDQAPQLDDLSAGFSVSTALDTTALGALSSTDPNNVLATTVVPAATLSKGGFANLNVTEDKIGGGGFTVAAGTQLQLQPGGSITLNNPSRSGSADILGSLVVPSGSISITSGGNIVVGPQARLDVAGQWINNDPQAAPGTATGSSEYLNGGSISLAANENSARGADGSIVDTSGSIILQPGSVLDLSGGGMMQANGQLLMQDGVPQGRGGSLALETYVAPQGQQFGNNGTSIAGAALPGTEPTNGRIEMNGTILSQGFSGGGTLTLQALGFQIGGDPAAVAPWSLVLPDSFFAQQGFGKYVLNAFYDATVAPGTTLALTQRNLIPDATALMHAASGTDLTSSGLTSPGTLDPYHRQPTDLVITAGAYTSWQDASGAIPSYADVTGAVTVGAGASIVADAGATVGLGSPRQVTVLGSIVAPGGAITLSADTTTFSAAQQGQFVGVVPIPSDSRSVWLGADAVLDVSGVALADPFAAPVRIGTSRAQPDTGKVLAGGSVTLSSDNGYVVAQAGSRIDVSGAATRFDAPQANGSWTPQPVWSDAGSITLAAGYGLFADGTLAAHGGAPEAAGGTLTILPKQNANAAGATTLVIRQSGELTPTGLAPGQSIANAIDPTTGQPIGGTPTGVLQFAADRLDDSGIANLVLGSGAQSRVASPAVSIAFAGDVKLALPGSITLNTDRIAAIGMNQLSTLLSSPATNLATILGQSPQPALGTTVELDAPYVALIGTPANNIAPAFTPVAALSDATLNVNASFIDLSNQIQLNDFGQANFSSSGDIRLSSTKVANTNAFAPGVLYSPGNLGFKAADLYPATGSTYIIDATGPIDAATGKPAATTVSFASNGASTTPLSAGGSLLVDATDIVQGGTIRVPSGSLVLGVGDPTDSATKALFGGLSQLVATDSVRLTSGSVTSVSNGGLVIPYGTTVDGVEWQFTPVVGAQAADLSAPPAKYIGLNASHVSLDPGAVIDLSGGGDLQAVEWVPGTGGTRDVLSQYSISYANSTAGVATPVNVGGSNVYAIVPGTQPQVAAYDPVYAQTAQPSTSANGSATTTTATLGLGQAGMGDAVGKSVYLSGVPGLPAGYYTLLPARYATLPGAFRVTLASGQGGAGNVAPGMSSTLPDGSVVTAGYFANSVTGSRSATPTLFTVQSNAVWQQYSQYTLTSANSFFATQAAAKGNVAPPAPVDGGQLVLAATQSLALGATLNAAAGPGGAPAEVDIASQDIQVTGNGGSALAGYLQIDANALDTLAAGSLLIGGTRTATSSGITINPIANSVVVSNDAASSLTGPEILLVTKTDTSGTDPDAANGLRIDAGASIVASGAYPAAKDQPITIAGDGALLRVSNGASVPLTRTGSSGTGLLTVGAGATLAGGQALLIDSSGDLKVDPAAVLSGHAITVDGSAITFTNQTGSSAANLPGFVISPAGLAQFANADEVTLRSYGTMAFVGDIDASFGNSVDLSAGTFTSDGGKVTLNAPKIAFTNESGAPNATPAAGSGTLTVNAGEIDFGTGTKALSGFASVDMTATAGIAGQGTGSFDFGAVPVSLAAPVYLADTNSNATIKTTGALTLNPGAGTALSRTEVGGAIGFVGGTLLDNGANIAAPAGNASLEATSGNLTIGGGSTISAAGVSKSFFDVTASVPGGNITLTADAGTVDVQAGSTLDFSGASGGGAAGSLTLSAPQQVVNLDGTLKGGAAAGFAGGSLSLNTGGALDLDSFAATLAASGVNDAISIRTKSGNLTLSAGNTLSARTVALNADGGAGNAGDTANGNVNIFGTIDASGTAGGEIDLYGHSGVDLEGTLLARGSDPNQRGGTVVIGTNGVFDPTAANPYNATYGYENIDASHAGTIRLGADALIDVSGGTAGGLSGGTVSFRAPLLSNGTVNLVMPAGGFHAGKGIAGSRATTLEAYAVWSTSDATTGAKHFDGIVDPAGWYDARGNLLAGTFTAQGSGASFSFTPDGKGGGTVKNTATGVSTALDASQLANGDTAIGFGGLANMYFAPGSANADHESFYGYVGGDATTGAPGTLMGFVQHGLDGVVNPLAAAGLANARIAPGIELDNPGSAVNGGNISVLTNWNLGAGSSAGDLDYRFNGQAPIVTLRAENNVEVKASLSDGFFQIANPTGGGGTIAVPALSTYDAVHTVFTAPSGYNGASYGYGLSYWAKSGQASAPGKVTGGTPDEIAEYYALYSAYADYLTAPAPQLANLLKLSHKNADFLEIIVPLVSNSIKPGQPLAPVAPSAAEQASNPAAYLLYLNAYQNYVVSTVQWEVQHPATPPNLAKLVAPAVQPVAVIGTASITIPGVTDNSPAPVANAGNPLPLLSASLAGGSSSSLRIVAGADPTSSNPLALASPPQGDAALPSGSVVLDGHASYLDSNGRLILAPTMIRTGAGSIDVAALGDIALYDPTSVSPGAAPTQVVPGVIYTAGVPSSDAPEQGTTVSISHPTGAGNYPDLFVSPTVNPDSAGDITLHAGGDILSIGQVTDATGAVTGKAGANLTQSWWQWMQIGNPKGAVGATSPVQQTVQTSIDFGAFDQGVMSVGGNVTVTAGGNIANLSVSLPTTWWLTNTNTDSPTVNLAGGGNLAVKAGGDILSGSYFVSKGSGTLAAGGQIAPDFSIAPQFGSQPVPVSTILALQDGSFDVTARLGVNIGQVVDPSYVEGTQTTAFNTLPDMQGYSTDSRVSITSTTGDVALGTLTNLSFIGGGAPIQLTPGHNDLSFVLPASVELTAFSGGITVASSGELFPSPVGNLDLLADQSISISSANTVGGVFGAGNFFGMLDNDPASMPSPTKPFADVPVLTDKRASAHAASALHADDTVPARIYSLEGSIFDGVPLASSGSPLYQDLVTIGIDKPALIQAGTDIANLSFLGQNLRTSDITRIVAGRDIYDTPVTQAVLPVVPAIVLGGPGTLDVEAGRNIGPLANAAQALSVHAYQAGTYTGIDAVGNAGNPNLPHESANINVLFGVGPGVDLASFAASYIDPAGAAAASAGTTPALIAFVEQYEAGKTTVDTGLLKDQPKLTPLSADQAWATFKTLPAHVQQLFAEQVLFGVLTRVGEDYNNPASPFFQKYARGFDAINTLFPASLGYTANNLTGGSNGANQLVDTGDLDIRNTTIQTQQGGNVSILGPGGQALVGSTSAPPELTGPGGAVVAGPGTMGILTLEKGDVDIFTDRSLLLAQSRIFTEQGGDMTIWSSNGDINAGKGAKSSADAPAPQYVCDANHYCTLDARGEVTGAGIATLQSIPGVPIGTINLIAPRGTVDAGDAGIRAGNLNVAALHVLNADNIQVTGKSTGIPVVQTVNTGALSAASSAASAASQMAQDLAKNNASGGGVRRWTISVQVEGFGDVGDDPKRRKREQVGYDSSNAVSVVGFGQEGPAHRAALSNEERARLGKI